MEQKNQSGTDVRLKILRAQIAQKESENNKSYGFTLSITLKDEPNKTIEIVERAQGIENFDAAITDAKEFDPHTIIVNTYRNKTEKPKKANEWRLAMVEEPKEHVIPLAEQIDESVKKQIAEMQETLKGVDGSGELGAVQKFEHLGKILTLNSEKEITAMKHANEVSGLNRQLTEKLDENEDLKTTIGELENDLEKVDGEFEEYKADKLSGITEGIEKGALQALVLAAKQFAPKLLGGAISGVSGDDGQKATIVESNDPIEIYLGQLRMLISSFDEATIKSFNRLIELIAADPGTIEIALELLEPNQKGGE